MYQTAGMIDGAIIGALVGLAMYPVFIKMAKQKQNAGQAMGKATVRQVLWMGGLDEALERASYILGQRKARIINADHGRGAILAGTSANWRSTGSTVHVYVRPALGGFSVEVHAAPSMAIKDMGDSKAFADNFIVDWMALGPPRGPGGPGQFVV